MLALKPLRTFAFAMLTFGMVSATPAQAQTGIVVDDIALDAPMFDPVTGLLTAESGAVTGTIVGLPFTTDLENFSLQLVGGGGGVCAILDLEVGAIDLDLLGLHVNTTPICLEIDAIAGGGLLGDLLCSVAGGELLLLPDLLDALAGVLTTSLAEQSGGPGPRDICDGDCVVLDLSLGPVNLSLLGLNVYLHDCEDGPIQVCVSASAGEGLLGDLLCGLAGDPLGLGNLTRLLRTLTAIAGLERIITNPGQLRKLIGIVQRALRDGVLSDSELDKLVKEIRKLLR